jgi:VanZ family protein
MIRTLWLTLGWAIIISIVYLSLATLTIQPDMDQGDKLGHLLAYGTLMAWWCQLISVPNARWKLALAFIALGAAMEFAQSLTPNRYPEMLDMVANTSGVLLGWLVAPPRIPSLYARLAAKFS